MAAKGKKVSSVFMEGTSFNPPTQTNKPTHTHIYKEWFFHRVDFSFLQAVAVEHC